MEFTKEEHLNNVLVTVFMKLLYLYTEVFNSTIKWLQKDLYYIQYFPKLLTLYVCILSKNLSLNIH